MHDDDNIIKRFGSSSNMSITHNDDKVHRHAYVSNSNSLAKGVCSFGDHALSASVEGDGDDDDDDGDFAPAA